jgi:hypothetical protein
VFFCSSLIQVNFYLKKEINENFNSELFNRLMILSGDNDISIRIETAFNLRFICLNLDGSFIKRNLLKTIESYLKEDNNIIKAEVLISIIRIFKKIYNEEADLNFIGFFMEKLSNFIEVNNNYNLSFYIFLTIINEYFDSLKDYINFVMMCTSNSIGLSKINLEIKKNTFYNFIKNFLKVK